MGGQHAMEQKEQGRAYQLLLFAGIVFIAFNLRPALTSVGPLIGTIRDDIGFANWSVALLTSLPLIAFAMMSPLAPKLANRLTNERALALGLVVLIIGISLRSISVLFFLFLGTLLIGLGIAVCNVLLPGVIKDKFPTKVAIMTSVYSTSMAIFATMASGVSVPLSEGLNLGWQFALSIWVVPAVFGVVIWVIISRKNNRDNGKVRFLDSTKGSGIWKSPLAWQVALFMGFQSSLFYITISWLPEILMGFGMEKTTAGLMLSFFQFIGIPVSFIIPMVAVKMRSQSFLILGVNSLYIIGIVTLLLSNSFVVTMIAVGCLGIASASNFALALSFFAIRAKNAKHAAELSGMAQSIGYLLAAMGPIAIGYIYDLTQVWTIPLYLLIGIMVIVIYFGMHAGQNKYVLD